MSELTKCTTKDVNPGPSHHKEVDEELSNEIALAVASIVAESRIKKNEESVLSLFTPKGSGIFKGSNKSNPMSLRSSISKGKTTKDRNNSTTKLAKSTNVVKDKKNKSRVANADHLGIKSKKGNIDGKKESKKDTLKRLGLIKSASNVLIAAGKKLSKTTFPSLMDGLLESSRKVAANFEKKVETEVG